MSELSDQELIEICLNQASTGFRAFETLVERYEPQVYQFCLRYLRNVEQAEDLTQESFLKAYNNLKNLEKPHNFKAWLIKIAANMCTDHYRKFKRRAEIQQQVEKELKIQQIGLEEQQEDLLGCLKKAIDKLKDKEKDVLMLHYFSELSVKEIALELCIGESAVKMRLSRARDKLTQIMEKK